MKLEALLNFFLDNVSRVQRSKAFVRRYSLENGIECHQQCSIFSAVRPISCLFFHSYSSMSFNFRRTRINTNRGAKQLGRVCVLFHFVHPLYAFLFMSLKIGEKNCVCLFALCRTNIYGFTHSTFFIADVINSVW